MTRTSQTNLPYRFSQSQMKEFSLLANNKIIDAKNNGMYYLEPFKHLVIDNFLHADLAQSCLDNFPSPNEDIWDRSYDENIEIKQRTIWKSEFDIPEAIVDTIRLLNSSIFLLALSETFNIKKLVPDPYFTGGVLNVTMPNGLLDVHVDGNYHDATGLNRRMNVIIYLNPKWQEGWGGEFGIYNNNGENCLKKLVPLFLIVLLHLIRTIKAIMVYQIHVNFQKVNIVNRSFYITIQKPLGNLLIILLTNLIELCGKNVILLIRMVILLENIAEIL